MQEFVNQFDISIFLFHFLVEVLDFGGLVVGEAGDIGVQFGDDGVPLSLVDTFGAGIVDVESQGLDFVEHCLPSGVDALVEIEFHLLVGASQRIIGNLVAAGGEVLFADGLNFLDRNIYGFSAVLVEGDEFAAHKVVGHFVLNSANGGDGVIGIVAIGTFIEDGSGRVVFSLNFFVEGFLYVGNVG